jgi:hypothetical protein
MTVSFNIPKSDFNVIRAIVDLALQIWPDADRMSLHMDLTACHANGNPLDLDRLLDADRFNFIHDVGGISHHIDRDTGQLKDEFTPRFHARRAGAAA